MNAQIRREPVIEQLFDGGSAKRELVEAVDASRSTIDRAIRELEEVDLVAQNGRGYRPTLYGRLAHEEFDEIVTRYESLTAAKELLVHLPPDAPVDLRMVEGAEVICTGECGPVAPYRRVEEMVETAAAVRATSPIVLPSYIDLFVRVIEDGTNVTLAFDSEVMDMLASAYPEAMDTAGDVCNCMVRETCEVPPYALILADEAVWLGVYGDGGSLVGALYNDSSEAVEWAGEVLSETCEAVEEF